MTTNAHKKYMDKLKTDKDFQDAAVRWMVSMDYHKKYEQCTSEISGDCVGTGLKIGFHGKQCPECRAEAKKRVYEKKKREKEAANAQKNKKEKKV